MIDSEYNSPTLWSAYKLRSIREQFCVYIWKIDSFHGGAQGGVYYVN